MARAYSHINILQDLCNVESYLVITSDELGHSMQDTLMCEDLQPIYDIYYPVKFGLGIPPCVLFLVLHLPPKRSRDCISVAAASSWCFLTF
jgi:hypothetical protein